MSQRDEMERVDYSPYIPETFDPDYDSYYWHGREEQVDEEERDPPNSPVAEPDSTVEENVKQETVVEEEETEKKVEDVNTGVVSDGGAEKEAEKEVEDVRPDVMSDGGAEKEAEKEAQFVKIEVVTIDGGEEKEVEQTQKIDDDADDENKENIPPNSQELEAVTETPDGSNSSPVVYVCYPSTPKPKRFRSRLNCDCVVLNTEYKRNRMSLAEDIERENKVDLQKKRRRLGEPERLLCAEFQISKGIIVRLVVLSDCLLPPGKRVVLTISSETNEICVVATSFLKGINSLNREFMNFTDEVEEDNEIELCDGTVFAEIMKDAEGFWMVFRQYIDEWVSERIYMSPKTWFEFRALCPLLSNCLDVYVSKLMQQDPIVARTFLF